jgi:predicted Zn-dependent protease
LTVALDESKSRKLTEDILAVARQVAPGADVFVSATSGRAANTRFASNQITSSGDVEETSVQIEVAFGKRHAAASTNQTSPSALRAAIEHAAAVARLAAPDPESMPPLPAQKYLAVPKGFDAATDVLPAAARAAAAQSAVRAAKDKGVVVAGYHSHGTVATALANSGGLFAYHLQTQAALSLTARTADGTGSGWAGACSHRAGDIDPGALAATAIEKAVRSVKARRLDPGRYTVVLEPSAVAYLCGTLIGAMNARQADEGRSFFAQAGGGNRVGEKLFGDSTNLRSNPADPDAPSAPFDGQGVPLAARTWIENGTVNGLLYSRYWAQKQRQSPTGSPEVWHFGGGAAADVGELLTGVKRGVLVTRFWYIRPVDPQTILYTGLTRDGVFLIENGEIAGPVNNFRFNESPVTVLKNADALTRATIRAVTAEGRPGRFRVPALRTREFNFASISDAV